MAVVEIAVSVVMGTLLTLLPPVESHARLWEPPGRSTMWRRGYQTPVNVQDNELFCGGFWHQVSLGYKCGVCGDSYDGKRDNEAGGKYATGIVTRTYMQGQEVTFQVDITANHRGFLEFKICPTNNPGKRETQECFDRYPLLLSETPSSRYYLSPNAGLMSVKLVLPRDLTCEFCVVQLRYHAGNSWGTDPDGKSCVGCGHQEEFYGCSDIRILSRGSSQSVSEGDTGLTPRDNVITNTTAASGRKPSDKETANQRQIHNTVDTTGITSTDNSRNFGGPSTDTSSHGETRIDGDNLVCGSVRDDEKSHQWCQVNCQLGNCPKTLCKCVKGEYQHSTERGTGCRAAGAFAKVAGYDVWCQNNCKLGNCPSSICVC